MSRPSVVAAAVAALASIALAGSPGAALAGPPDGAAHNPPDGAAGAPRGAVEVTGQLLLAGGTPRSRAGASVTAYVGRRLGVRAAVGLVTVARPGDAGLATLGVVYRAAAARPRLEIVVRAEAGVAWPVAPAVGGGVTTYLWPTRLPVALTFDLGAAVILDGVEDSRAAVSLGVGLALAR